MPWQLKSNRRSVGSVNICSSLFFLELHAWLYNNRLYVYAFYCLGKNKLSLYTEIIFLSLTENVVNCFALNPVPPPPHPPLPRKRHMTFFRDQTELRVAPKYLMMENNKIKQQEKNKTHTNLEKFFWERLVNKNGWQHCLSGRRMCVTYMYYLH